MAPGHGRQDRRGGLEGQTSLQGLRQGRLVAGVFLLKQEGRSDDLK